MAVTEKGADVDPITLSVVWNRLLTITRECGERVVHSSQSFVMALARDLGPVLLTPQAEIVTTVEEQRKGLGGRTDLSMQQGMLFPYDTVEEKIFWMKGMRIPIDIIWIRRGKIVHIQKNVPPPPSLMVPDRQLARYGTGIFADAVLEVAAGFCELFGVKPGHLVQPVP